ncbi:dipeptidase AC. Metallo peptidase. MEROPS family M19 [Rhizobium sp. RU20A]|uniref:dipeptidase n=1 Tax=Rhizobium sp. RU20A TaxID=1907412 RepID=UPI000955BA97|nr:dipeptidase [Rhizobium sp. RU20A]SIQ30356.1 dipeptidase AC. Metallo peptidase. MEROPS family M19 [Rhizobium sp. RU20A]
MQAVFDGHNDVLLRLWSHQRRGGDPIAEFIDGAPNGHIDGPRAREGGLAGGISAIYIPSDGIILRQPDENGHYDTPMSPPLERHSSLDIAMEMAAIALQLHRAGAWRLCRSVADIRAAMADGIFAAVLHMEGCEAISADLSELEVFHAAGLRSLGPVWSRNNIFGHGVPFAFPRTPDMGPGLTEAGEALVKACDRLGILVDCAHITEKGFWDVARVSDRPLIHSHSNVHALTPVARNLTDRQMDAIAERKGVAGLNFATTMLREDGLENALTPVSAMVRHIDYMVERMGIDCVALGSDYDGATIPAEIGDAAGTQVLVDALRDAGYGDDDLAKLTRENWLRVLAGAFGETA